MDCAIAWLENCQRPKSNNALTAGTSIALSVAAETRSVASAAPDNTPKGYTRVIKTNHINSRLHSAASLSSSPYVLPIMSAQRQTRNHARRERAALADAVQHTQERPAVEVTEEGEGSDHSSLHSRTSRSVTGAVSHVEGSQDHSQGVEPQSISDASLPSPRFCLMICKELQLCSRDTSEGKVK